MPGAGKSTIGKLLADKLELGFIDTDKLLEQRFQNSLQQLLEQFGYLRLRDMEAQLVLDLGVTDHVIATGGSVVYSVRAMNHLASISKVVFLEAGFSTISSRIDNLDTRGLAKNPKQSFAGLFAERQALYKKHAEITIVTDGLSEEQAVAKLLGAIS